MMTASPSSSSSDHATDRAKCETGKKSEHLFSLKMDLLFLERRKLGPPISFFAGPFFANVFSPVARVFFLAANGSIWLRGTLANRPRSFILRKCQQRSRKIAFKSERRHTSFLPVWRFRTSNLAEYEKILSDYTILSDFRLT